MSVKPATDEQIELCRGAGIPDRLTNKLIARIEAERTRAEEAEALLREALQGVEPSSHLAARIKAHLKEHTDG